MRNMTHQFAHIETLEREALADSSGDRSQSDRGPYAGDSHSGGGRRAR